MPTPWKRRPPPPPKPPDISDLIGAIQTENSALIAAIQAEGRANRGEERREDFWKTIREWLTIGVISATLLAIVLQVREMQKVYGPIATQATATSSAASAAAAQIINQDKITEQTTRAWVGPLNVAFEAQPTSSAPSNLLLQYENPGREPATAFIPALSTYSLKPKEFDTPPAYARINQFVAGCSKAEAPRGANVYPTNGFNSYTYSVTMSPLGQPFFDSKSMLIVQGCFLYQTFGKQHHSAFCYYFLPGKTNFQHLNICSLGADAN